MAWFDIALVAILALSTIFAFFRGFVTEALHLAALGGAIVATIIGFPFAEPWLIEQTDSPLAVKIIGNTATFILVLALLRVIANFIGSKVRQSDIGFIDRSFGAIFGFVRGFLIVVFVYILFIRLWQPEENPDFIQQAKLGVFVTKAAEIFDPYLNGSTVKSLIDKTQIIKPAVHQEDDADILDAPAPQSKKRAAKTLEQGYEDAEREALDKAIDTALDTVLDRMRGEGVEEAPPPDKKP